MSTSSPRSADISSPSPQRLGQPSQSSPSSSPAWLETLIFNARVVTTGAEALPFPYVKGLLGMVVFLLDTVDKMKKNQDSMKELCGDAVEIITILRDQISSNGDTAALKFKGKCEELESSLQDVVKAVNQLQSRPRNFSDRIKEAIKSNSTADEIRRFQTRIWELRSNFMLMATMDTNFQVQKVLNMVSPPSLVVAQVMQTINNCSPPSRIFHGRQTILDQMDQFFTQSIGKQAIFLLHGLGGAGKTQIALKFIEESASHFTDIFFIDSSSTTTIETGLKNITETKNIGDSPESALKWLRGKQDNWLLLFDNADNPKINLNNYFPNCNHGNILITSRNPGLCVYASSHSPVSDMEETDAVNLLLRSAGQDTTDCNTVTSIPIVKMFYYLPLAIIQAGAFISKSGDLGSYLALYELNRARLLSQKPTQSHDAYAWTVYTTWQISFEQLSQPAAMFLQLCSLLHHQGISEQIFKNATNYRFCDATRVRGASRWLKQDLRSGCSHRRRTPPRKESHKDEAAVSGLASTCNPCAKGTVDPGSGSCDLGGTGSSYTHAQASVASWGCPYALGAIIRSPRA
ncbi:P-loop containing nucleoside triphosphate hydrolase protein [Mycena epipterygia]|nr:P-loop containing nucleoside triphosphate hydrolase protein [Mycena epipterygia]